MESFNPTVLKNLYLPPASSHKGQNGKLMIIGGSQLFHAGSLWSLQIASKIVDMVFYSSIPENNLLVEQLRKEFRNGIIIRREDIRDYVQEADAVLLGPGMVRTEKPLEIAATVDYQLKDLTELAEIEHEGIQTYYLTKYLLQKYPEKKWVIDAGALQMMEPEWLHPLQGNVILTPHSREFERLESGIKSQALRQWLTNKDIVDKVKRFVQEYKSIVLLKGEKDIVCSPENCIEIAGGNAGMTKGGTGDVLAGLVAALSCKNDLVLAATAGSYFNKKAGESLFEKVGYYFNASDLAEEIPRVMKKEVVQEK